jgi:hypothetical protein
MKLARGWRRSGMSGTLTEHQSNLSSDTWAGLGKGWKTWGNPYPHTRVWWLVPFFRVGTTIHLCRVWKPEVLRDGTIRLFLLSIPMVVLMMNLDDDMNYICWSLISLSWTFNANTSNNGFIACHLRKPYAFMQMYKCLIILFASTKYLCVGINSCEYAMYSRCCH